MQPVSYISPNRPGTELIRQARQGVLRRRVDEVAKLVGLTDKEMAYILNISVRGLHGKPASEALTLAAGERLLLLERLVTHGLLVFDGQVDLLVRWLRTPLLELAYREVADEVHQDPVLVQNLGRFGEPFDLAQPAVVSDKTSSKRLSPLVLQSPLDVLDTVSGFLLADDVLGRIEWGIAG